MVKCLLKRSVIINKDKVILNLLKYWIIDFQDRILTPAKLLLKAEKIQILRKSSRWICYGVCSLITAVKQERKLTFTLSLVPSVLLLHEENIQNERLAGKLDWWSVEMEEHQGQGTDGKSWHTETTALPKISGKHFFCWTSKYHVQLAKRNSAPKNNCCLISEIWHVAPKK